MVKEFSNDTSLLNTSHSPSSCRCLLLDSQSRHILTSLKRDIQCEKFIEDESVSHVPCDSMYPNRVKEREDEVNNWNRKTYSNTQTLGN